MNVEILTPEKKLYSGDVYGVQLPGITGLFEILEKHAPLVSALGKGIVKILKDKNSSEKFSIESGFVEVLNNKVIVLVYNAWAPSTKTITLLFNTSTNPLSIENFSVLFLSLRILTIPFPSALTSGACFSSTSNKPVVPGN